MIILTNGVLLLVCDFSFIFLGAMWALGNTVTIVAAQTAVEPARVSVATGTTVTMFNVGGSIGLAMAVAIYHHFALRHLQQVFSMQLANASPERLNYFQQLIANPSHSLQVVMDPVSHGLFNDAFIHGFSGVMFMLLALAVLGLLTIGAWRGLTQK